MIRVKKATSPPWSQQRLLKALQVLELNPLIKNVSAELASRVRTGNNLLNVNIVEVKYLTSK